MFPEVSRFLPYSVRPRSMLGRCTVYPMYLKYRMNDADLMSDKKSLGGASERSASEGDPSRGRYTLAASEFLRIDDP
jgi:hypothetical protein